MTGKSATFRSPRHRGISLTEVVVASALMLVSVVPILHALTTAQVTARRIEWKTRSLTLAQAKLDEIRAQANASFDQWFNQTSVSLDGAYRCTVVDTYALLAVIRTITVSVGYDSNGNGTLASDEILVTLKTQIARR
jgi:Tfp pilus assembly protein PilV